MTVFLFALFAVIAFLSGCSNRKGPAPGRETGAIVVSWETGESGKTGVGRGARAPAVKALQTVDADVFDSTGTLAAHGGPWDYGDGEGAVEGVPPGDGFMVFIAVRDSTGLVVSVGEVSGVSVSAGKTTVPPRASLHNFPENTLDWVPAGSLGAARMGHTAVKLFDGKVLVAGGYGMVNRVATLLPGCELYDPASDTWSPAGALSAARMSHTATQLADGRVLVAGGYSWAGYGVEALASCEVYNPDPDVITWLNACGLNYARHSHSATLLQDGRVLVAGGIRYTEHAKETLTSCEIHDPGNNTWRVAGFLTTPRAGHSAFLLEDGRVLIAGGDREGNGEWDDILRSCEIFDPVLERSVPLEGGLQWGRTGPETVRLPDGSLVVSGGFVGSASFCRHHEVYDPSDAAPAWRQLGTLLMSRMGHTATLLGNGEVLCVGGCGFTSSTAYCELFDSRTEAGRFAAGKLARPTAFPRYSHTATLLDDGSVLVAGGSTAAPGSPTVTTSSCERYPFGFSSDNTPPLLKTTRPARGGSGAAVDCEIFLHIVDPLPEGGGFSGVKRESVEVRIDGEIAFDDGDFKVYSNFSGRMVPDGSGGFYLTVTRHPQFSPGAGVHVDVTAEDLAPEPGPNRMNESFSFTCSRGFWRATGNTEEFRFGHTATLLKDGRVLIVGGGVFSGDRLLPVNSCELYDPSTERWTTESGLGRAYGHTATLLPDGKVLVAGGCFVMEIAGMATCICVPYDPNVLGPDKWLWSSFSNLNTAREGHTATLLQNGMVLAAGGRDRGTILSSCELYDPGTNSWIPTGSLHVPRAAHTAALLPDGRVLVAGGDGGNFPLDSCEVYDPSSGLWTLLENRMSVPRSGHEAALLPDGRLIVMGGFRGSAMFTETCESLDTLAPNARWVPVGRLARPKSGFTATLLSGGGILVAGGSTFFDGDLAECERFDPSAGLWSAAAGFGGPRTAHTATLLKDGSVLVAGGRNGTSALNACRRYVEGTPPTE